MYRIALVNLPFSTVTMPSIALAQLRSVIRTELGDRVEVKTFHPNLDCMSFLGPQLYGMISGSVQANTSGLGDWFFSREAFPEMPDNTELYLTRHFAEYQAQLVMFKSVVAAKRSAAGAFLEQVIDRYQLDTYSFVGLTSMFSQNLACFALARRLKARNPAIVVAMGGANCESPMGNVIVRNVDAVDFVFSGPALRSFPQVVRHLADGQADQCHRVPGVLSKRKLALQGSAGGREIGEELDIDADVELDYDDYFEALKQQRLDGAVDVKIPFETSRGCWWGERSHCTFCGLNGATMKYRAMQPQKAIDLLHKLFDKYGSRTTELQSVDNILPREYLTEVLPHLETPDHLRIFYEVKADLKLREMAELARARVTAIQPGIEAMSTSTLKLMRKGTTAFQNIRFLQHCVLYGIVPLWNLLLGFPREEEEVYRKYYEDLPLLTHLHPPSGAYPVRFDRYSPYHTHAAEYGLKLQACDFYGMIYPFGRDELQTLAYYFVDEDYNAPYIHNTAKWIGKLRQRIEAWHHRWHQADGLLKPELSFRRRGATDYVYDSRSGRAVEHRLTEVGLRVARALAKPLKIARAAEVLELAQGEVAAQIAVLKEKGLIFQEGDLYMSVVIEPEEGKDLHFPPSAFGEGLPVQASA